MDSSSTLRGFNVVEEAIAAKTVAVPAVAATEISEASAIAKEAARVEGALSVDRGGGIDGEDG